VRDVTNPLAKGASNGGGVGGSHRVRSKVGVLARRTGWVSRRKERKTGKRKRKEVSTYLPEQKVFSCMPPGPDKRKESESRKQGD